MKDPLEVNLLNEKNNGETVLKLINNDLVCSVHDISSGGLIVSLAEMSISSNFGLKIEKPKKLTELNQYFYGEDQGRYLLEVRKSELPKLMKILNDNSIYNEIVGLVQKDYLELDGEFKFNINDLSKLNNSWYYNY